MAGGENNHCYCDGQSCMRKEKKRDGDGREGRVSGWEIAMNRKERSGLDG